MSLRWYVAAAALLAAGSVSAQQGSAQGSPPQAAAAGAAAAQPQKPPAPLTAADKPNLSYAVGYQIGTDFVERKIDIDINAVIRAMQDGYAKRPPTVPMETMRDVLGRMQYQVYSQAKNEFEKGLAEGKAASAKEPPEDSGSPGA